MVLANFGHVDGEEIDLYGTFVEAPLHFRGQDFFAIVSCCIDGLRMGADDMVTVQRDVALGGVWLSKYDGVGISGECAVQFILW